MISIVTTAYNVSKYMDKCIQSVLSQTYTDLEYIIVNDCSTDNTLDIIKSYNDPRIKIINNEKNVGAGLSRRYGIQASTGEYVLLLDGDDYLDSNYIKELYDKAIEEDADIVSGGVTLVNEDTYDVITMTSKPLGVYTSDADKFKNAVDGSTFCFISNKIVRRTLYDKVEYCDRRYIEDTPVLIKLLYYANKTVYVPNNGYYYVQRKGSLVESHTLPQQILFEFLYFIDMIEFFKDKPDSAGYKTYKFKCLLTQLKVMELNGVQPNDMKPWAEEWNFIVDYIKSNL